MKPKIIVKLDSNWDVELSREVIDFIAEFDRIHNYKISEVKFGFNHINIVIKKNYIDRSFFNSMNKKGLICLLISRRKDSFRVLFGRCVEKWALQHET